jgi:hypothetical protein
MKLESSKRILVVIGLLTTIIIALPSITMVLNFPGGEPFYEIYLLVGSPRQAEGYPYNITSNKDYSVYVDVSSSLGSLAYFKLYGKFGNENDLLPNATSGEPSPLTPLFESQFVVQDSKTWETKVTFSVSNVSSFGNQTKIETLTINNIEYTVNKSSTLNSSDYNMIFELWVYNSTVSEFQYNNHAIWFKLNVT